MVSVRAGNHVFHISLLSSPEVVKAAIGMLEVATDGLPIYGKNPENLVTTLQIDFGWTPEIVNVIPMVPSRNNNPSINDLANEAFGGRTCAKYQTFSAHVTPSAEALRHAEQVLAAIYKLGEKSYKKRKEESADELQIVGEVNVVTPPPSETFVVPESRLRPPVRTVAKTPQTGLMLPPPPRTVVQVSQPSTSGHASRSHTSTGESHDQQRSHSSASTHRDREAAQDRHARTTSTSSLRQVKDPGVGSHPYRDFRRVESHSGTRARGLATATADRPSSSHPSHPRRRSPGEERRHPSPEDRGKGAGRKRHHGSRDLAEQGDPVREDAHSKKGRGHVRP